MLQIRNWRIVVICVLIVRTRTEFRMKNVNIIILITQNTHQLKLILTQTPPIDLLHLNQGYSVNLSFLIVTLDTRMDLDTTQTATSANVTHIYSVVLTLMAYRLSLIMKYTQWISTFCESRPPWIKSEPIIVKVRNYIQKTMCFLSHGNSTKKTSCLMLRCYSAIYHYLFPKVFPLP